jgi:hypothetical protein
MARKKVVTLSAEHQVLADRIGFDPEVLEAVVKCNLPELRQVTVERVGPDHHLTDVPAAGFCFDAHRIRAESIMRSLRERFGKKGYLFFLTRSGVPEPPATVAAIRGADQYDILRFVGTQDINGDQTTEDIIAVLQVWEARHPFRIAGAGTDWVEGRFRKNPEDMLAFAKEVIHLAPDSYGQADYADEEAFAADMRQARSFYLWWD